MNEHCQDNLQKYDDVKISFAIGMSGLYMVLGTFLIRLLVSKDISLIHILIQVRR